MITKVAGVGPPQKTIMKKYLAAYVMIVAEMFVLCPFSAIAKDINQITDWYIKDFQSTITVNADSSLLIEEKIIADCGNLPDKHGIFRVVPTQSKTGQGTIKTPTTLIGITDFEGNKIHYSETTDNFNHTITWKIGDAEKTVTGENFYKITYLVKNAVRSGNADFDELYWNLSGNFWDIEIDNFSANIIFPAGIYQANSNVYLYSGDLGQNGNKLADYEWINANTLQISSKQTIPTRQGITASITFPKNIITPYNPGFFELYGNYLWFLIPLLIFIFSFSIWNKYGKDPVVNKTIVPEFEIPENLTPMEMGMIARNGGFDDKFISAAIVDLAVKKFIVIQDIGKQGIFGKSDFNLKKAQSGDIQFAPVGVEAMLVERIFGSSQEILLADLKNCFYKDLPDIKNAAIESLKNKNLIYQSGLTLKTVLLFLAVILMFIMFANIGTGNLNIIAALGLSAATALGFGLLMPKRTPKGAELNWRIKGFKLYMETAEKYRAQFNEKENIFEKFLPYAMVFGMTKLWIKKMEEIYGKDYFTNYNPIWYVGNFARGFDADSFNSQINSISAGIASNIGSPSGAGGSGFSGGGGGGGSGGGW